MIRLVRHMAHHKLSGLPGGGGGANFYSYDWIRVLRGTRAQASGPGAKPAPTGAAFSLLLTGWGRLLWRFRRALEQLHSYAVTSP